MGQNFIPDTVNRTLLLPPSLHDWLPEVHLARFLLDVVSALDLSAIYTSYQEKDGRGQAAYAPEMMVRLLLYGYARASTVRARFRRAHSMTCASVIFPATSTPATPPSPSSASVIWRRSRVCSPRLFCCVPRRDW